MNIIDDSKKLKSIDKVQSVDVMADGEELLVESVVVVEHTLNLYVNERLAARLVCTPTDIPYMILGRLISAGIIEGVCDVECIFISEDAKTVKVTLTNSIPMEYVLEKESTSCTGNKLYLKKEGGRKAEPFGDVKPNREWVFAMADAFANGSKLHKVTKGTHSCYLGVEGKVVYVSEDIGRHNALDKAIGYMTVNCIEPDRCMLYTTGRVPTDMVEKVVAARIPVLISKAVVTDEAVRMAKECNLTLICKAWPDMYEQVLY